LWPAAKNDRTISLSGPPPASRVVVSTFDSLEKAQAAYTSPAYVEARKIGDQYGKLRISPSKGCRNRVNLLMAFFGKLFCPATRVRLRAPSKSGGRLWAFFTPWNRFSKNSVGFKG
jgi:hypothetical protein